MTIDQNLDWQEHTNNVHKKFNRRLFFLRKLKQNKIQEKLLSLFYKSALESILTFCIIGWGGNSRQLNKTKLDRLIRKAGKITSSSYTNFDSLLTSLSLKKIEKIEKDQNHPLQNEIIRSKRTNRVILIQCKKERYRRSFVPSAIKLLCWKWRLIRTEILCHLGESVWVYVCLQVRECGGIWVCLSAWVVVYVCELCIYIMYYFIYACNVYTPKQCAIIGQ